MMPLSASIMVTSAQQLIGVAEYKVESPTVKTSTSGKKKIHQRRVRRLTFYFYLRIGFKSPATISQSQETAQYDGTPGTLVARGRHDPCVVPRAVPIVEAMAALVVMDELLIQNARKSTASLLPPVTTLPPTMILPARE
jgi:Chorismate synthase